MLTAFYMGLFTPFVSFLLLIVLQKIVTKKLVSFIACGAIFLSFCCFCALLFNQQNLIQQKIYLYSWLSLPSMQANIVFQLDNLALLMTLIITGIGFLIHVYSIGYIEYEISFVRYFSLLNFFIFSMLLLVLAGDLLLLFVGWEGVGLASYLLIGYWYEKNSAAQAATKAFIVNRIGDASLLVGILLTFYLFGTTDIETITQLARQQFKIGTPIITILSLLYFFGATGKSAQLPLYNWLPDAMEGPTPVSALIHAATMVTAGIYLIVRMQPIFLLSPFTMYIVAITGAVTALFAALCASAQTELKRVLAYSTISQLGFMFLACGIGAFYAAMFHLTAHAFVKALLFLAAGNVLHLLHGTTEMEKMGGLAKYLPKTSTFFLLGSLALAGIPPTVTFFSKDLILEQTRLSHFPFLFAVACLAAIITGFYMIRAYCITFLNGTNKKEENRSELQEAPFVMNFPISILAFLTIVGGVLGYSFNQTPLLEKFLSSPLQSYSIEKDLANGFLFDTYTVFIILASCTSVLVTFIFYTRFYRLLTAPVLFLKKAFYLDSFYYLFIAVPLKKLADVISYRVEPEIFGKSLDKTTQIAQKMAESLQKMQSGQIRSYGAWMIIASVLLLVYFVL